jgi:hypothetical protein
MAEISDLYTIQAPNIRRLKVTEWAQHTSFYISIIFHRTYWCKKWNWGCSRTQHSEGHLERKKNAENYIIAILPVSKSIVTYKGHVAKN